MTRFETMHRTVQPNGEPTPNDLAKLEPQTKQYLTTDPEQLMREMEALEHFTVDDLTNWYIHEASITPLLTPLEEIDLTRQMHHGDEEARTHLILANLRLVISVSKKYIGRGMPYLDLMQEGNIGLMKALKNFDPDRGFRLSTYVTWGIKQEIERAIPTQGVTNVLPDNYVQQMNKIIRIQRNLTQQLKREATAGDIRDYMRHEPDFDLSLETIQKYLDNAKPIRLISELIDAGNEQGAELGDTLEDPLDTPEEITDQTLLRETVRAIVGSLPPKEARVLQLRFGLVNGKNYTLEEVGEIIGCKGENVRRIEEKGLQRLAGPQYRRRLRELLHDTRSS